MLVIIIITRHLYLDAIRYLELNIFLIELDFSPNLDPFIAVLVSDLVDPITNGELDNISFFILFFHLCLYQYV